MAFSPLMEEEHGFYHLNNILYGTAADWCAVVWLETFICRNLEHYFLSAFPSGNYIGQIKGQFGTCVHGGGEKYPALKNASTIFQRLMEKTLEELTFFIPG